MNCEKCGKYSGHYKYCRNCYDELYTEVEEDEDEDF